MYNEITKEHKNQSPCIIYYNTTKIPHKPHPHIFLQTTI